MRYCYAPFKQIYLDFNGNVRFCGWSNGEPIGNILTEDLRDIWTSERANLVRHDILDGNFNYCRKDICPYIMGNTLPQSPVSYEDIFKQYPEKIELSYDYVCNLSCPSCRKKPILGSPRSDKFFLEMKDKVSDFLNKARILTFGGHGDPIYSKHSFELIKNLKPEHDDLHIIIQTNGICFTREIWREIEHLSEYRISLIISIDSLNPVVYSKLRRGGNLPTLLKNIEFISSLRKSEAINSLSAVMVVQDLNFMEIPIFTEFCFKKGFDKVELENLYNWGTFDDKEYFSKNLLNPNHPNHNFFKKILLRALKDKRVHCWAGESNRVVNKWLVTHQAPYAICPVDTTDCIELSSSLDELSSSIWNRDFIFVTDNDKYYGTIFYNDFHNYMSTPQCNCNGISHLINRTLVPIQCDAISAILTDPCQQEKQGLVVPIVQDGRLIGKLLPA